MIDKIQELLVLEERRQAQTINLIASENYPFKAVRDALSSWAGVKYAEGTPGRRYYAGCEILDEVERTAEQYALELFVPAEHRDAYRATVQPHSGTQANMIALFGVVPEHSTILSMALSMGGHLSHGHPKSFAGSYYKIASYGVSRETELIDFAQIEQQAALEKPTLIIAGASSYSRVIDFALFGAIARKHNSLLLADIAHTAGLIAAGCHPSPFPHADIVTFTTHKTLAGPRGGVIIYRKEFGDKILRSQLPGIQGGPFMNNIGAKAIAFALACSPEFREEQRAVITNAQRLAEHLSSHLRIISGGTDSHLLLAETISSLFAISGGEAEERLASHGLICNRNPLPFDTRSPRDPSGIRIGLSAMTRRGLRSESDARELGDLILTALACTTPSTDLKKKVERFAARFPLPLS